MKLFNFHYVRIDNLNPVLLKTYHDRLKFIYSDYALELDFQGNYEPFEE